jgi:trehalose/maltose hydrolase-like predicted phosphorylase
VMARWNLRRAAALPELEDERERASWLKLADALVDGYDESTGLYEQFAGFFELEPLVIEEVAPRRPVVAELLFGRERLRGAQVVKQADVLMLHHLVPDEVAPGSLTPNLEFYEPRTAHGSSLSPGVHASLFARAGMLERAVDALRLTSRIDLEDLTETTASGLHLAAMGSVWQALAFGFAGLRPDQGSLCVDPRLPEAWGSLELRVRFRGVPLTVRIEPDALVLAAEAPLRVLVGARRLPVLVRAAHVIRMARRGTSWEEVTR